MSSVGGDSRGHHQGALATGTSRFIGSVYAAQLEIGERRRSAERRAAEPRFSGHARGTGRIDLGQATDFAGDGEEVVRGVDRVLGGVVQLVEHGPDEGGLTNVLRDAYALCAGCARDGRVRPVGEADRGRVEGQGGTYPARALTSTAAMCGSGDAIAVGGDAVAAERSQDASLRLFVAPRGLPKVVLLGGLALVALASRRSRARTR